jgi:hypothetical protein
MLTDDEIRALRDGCEGVTPGKWIGSPVISSMAGLPVVASSGRLICDMNHVRHSKIDQFVEGDKAFNSESIRNAAHIARCDPTTIAELCTRLLSAETRVKVLEEAGSALIADVKRRHPGEELHCQYMRSLDAALQEQSK